MAVAVWLRYLGLLLLAVVVFACASPDPQSLPVPVLMFLNASPDRLTLEAIVPSSLIRSVGSVELLQQKLQGIKEPFAILLFGKALAVVTSTERRVLANFGGIAVFKLDQPFQNNRVLSQRGMILLPQPQANPLPEAVPSYQYNCPSLVQSIILQTLQKEASKLGITPEQAKQVAIASVVCVDTDMDQVPEIVTGLRLDNPVRPPATDGVAWQKFLSLPPQQREEASFLVLLRPVAQQWRIEPIISQRRALSYFNDSVSSYVLMNAHDLDGDRRLELVVQEVGLSSLGVWVVTPNQNTATIATQPWLDYYQPERSLFLTE